MCDVFMMFFWDIYSEVWQVFKLLQFIEGQVVIETLVMSVLYKIDTWSFNVSSKISS